MNRSPWVLPASALLWVGAPWDPGEVRAYCVALPTKLRSRCRFLHGAEHRGVYVTWPRLLLLAPLPTHWWTKQPLWELGLWRGSDLLPGRVGARAVLFPASFHAFTQFFKLRREHTGWLGTASPW